MVVEPEFVVLKKRVLKYFYKNISKNVFNRYYKMTSGSFFEKYAKALKKNQPDVVFLDGLHTYEQTLEDAINALKFLKDDGVIIMHDCNPTSEVHAFPAKSYAHAAGLNLPGWTGYWSGDVWKTIAHLRATRNDLDIFVLDCDLGLGIITKGAQSSRLKYSPEEIKNLTYKDLEQNREQMLNLRPTQYLGEFINRF